MNRSHKRHPRTHLPDANMVSLPILLSTTIPSNASGIRSLERGLLTNHHPTKGSFHVGNPEGIHQLAESLQ
ncbi:catalase [Penicillium chermesinum]|uniref:Catalase n=1 Tax=Penicillium chermesinum TaxID=63820 RepID=A0A9W9P0K3_9EURO|nr:catalase [Penicillium chermesinum]KAJ5233159.1 catalase [Penicillium chermesinum]KAJ6172795.1 catalase [Penicillium chermesinum]